MHAMRGISAHSNGFHTCRALHLLQMLLGAIDTPGSFRYQPPYPKPAPPANRPGKTRKPNGALDARPLGYVHAPEDLLVDADGQPRRIDKAFSWEHPFAAHGMLQSVIRNAWAGDPYRIDTLFLFMANMGWNSAMNTTETRRMLTDRDAATGEYRIPHIIYVDAYASETVAFADLVLPDTTYLERHDCISLLDRPISDADGAADAIRQPVSYARRSRSRRAAVPGGAARSRRAPEAAGTRRRRRPREISARLRALHRRTRTLARRRPARGLARSRWRCSGNRRAESRSARRATSRTAATGAAKCPRPARYYKMANRDYLEWAKSLGFVGSTSPITLQFYAETLQRFRLAAQGHGAAQPSARDRARVERYFDPLPFWYASLEEDDLVRASLKHQHACINAPLLPLREKAG